MLAEVVIYDHVKVLYWTCGFARISTLMKLKPSMELIKGEAVLHIRLVPKTQNTQEITISQIIISPKVLLQIGSIDIALTSAINFIKQRDNTKSLMPAKNFLLNFYIYQLLCLLRYQPHQLLLQLFHRLCLRSERPRLAILSRRFRLDFIFIDFDLF